MHSKFETWIFVPPQANSRCHLGETKEVVERLPLPKKILYPTELKLQIISGADMLTLHGRSREVDGLSGGRTLRGDALPSIRNVLFPELAAI